MGYNAVFMNKFTTLRGIIVYLKYRFDDVTIGCLKKFIFFCSHSMSVSEQTLVDVRFFWPFVRNDKSEYRVLSWPHHDRGESIQLTDELVPQYVTRRVPKNRDKCAMVSQRRIAVEERTTPCVRMHKKLMDLPFSRSAKNDMTTTQTGLYRMIQGLRYNNVVL